MAAKAFILIETVVGRIKEVVSTLQQLEGVKSADCVTGPYDIIAVVEGENLNSKLRDELLNGEVFTTLTEARILIEQWRREYNHFRPHSSQLSAPAPEAKLSLTLT